MLRAAHHREAFMLVTLIYRIPDGLLCLVVIGLVAAVSMAGLWLVHHRVPEDVRRRHNEIAGYLINVVGVIFAVILAFLAVAVWEAAGRAQDVVEAEANEATDIIRNAGVYPEAVARRLRAGLQEYLTIVVTEEWRLQQDGAMSPRAWHTIEDVHTAILAFKPGTPGESIVHEIVLRHVDDLINARRSRQHLMGSSLNPVIWIVLFVLTVLTIVSCYFIGSHGIRVQMTLTAFVGAAIGAMLSLIIALDYPFRGSVSIDPVPFQRVLDDLDRFSRRVPS
jgi:tryptophan-rich sensory protein